MSVFRDAGDNKKYTDKYEFYKRTNNRSFETRNITPDGIFYACDVVDYHETQELANGMSLSTRRYLTIETPSRLEFHPGDKIKSIKDDMDWAIRKVTINDDSQSKEYALRPRKITTLELEG